MNKNALSVAAALCAASLLCAQGDARFAMKVLPASNLVVKGPAGTTGSGSADLSVAVSSTEAGVQGWSFGIIVEPGAGATMNISSVAMSQATLTAACGKALGFVDTAYFTSADLGTPVLPKVPADGTVVSGIPDCAAVTQGIVVDMMQACSLGVITDLEVLDITVDVTGPIGEALAEIGRVAFTEAVGTPPTSTVVVFGGGSFPPAVMAPAVFSSAPAVCAAAKDFSIWLSSVECGTGAAVESIVTLNFNGNGTNEGVEIQGWSFGICADPLLEITAANIDGLDVATVNKGGPPGFNTITVFPDGVTQGVVIDMMAAVSLPVTNDYEALRIVMTANVDEVNSVANLRTCDSALGTPPTPNVMVITGNSIPGSTFDGVLADRESDTGCCPEALAGEGRACNKPAEIRFSPGVKFVPGSANGDGRLDIADGIFILNALFRDGRAIPCMKAADANGDCQVDATDAVYIIYYQFLDGPAPVYGTGCQVISNDVCPDLPCDVPENCQA